VADLTGARVALVLATSTGGVGRHVRSLAAGLGGYNASVTVVGPAATEAAFRFTSTGARFRPVGIDVVLRAVNAVRAWARLRVLLGAADVVHAHGLRAGLLAGLATRRRTPYVVTWHNALLPNGAGRRRVATLLELAVARRADRTFAVSGDLVERVRHLGGRDVRLLLVPAPPLLEPAPPSVAAVRGELGAIGRPLVLAVGRLHPQKDFPTLIEAARYWVDRSPQPVVAIAGEGPARAELERAIAAGGSGVRLLGQRSDVAALLAAADVVVLPSVWEGSPLAAQEALAAGRPLVATAVGGVPELVGDGAVLVPAGDPVALARAVVGLLDDPRAAAVVAAKAAARAAGWPDEAATVSAVAAAYAELLGRPA